MKKYIIPQAKAIKIESSEQLLQSSYDYVGIGGPKTDNFDSNRRNSIFGDESDEEGKIW